MSKTISDSEASEALALRELTTFPTASTIPLPGHHLQPAPELNAPTADPPFLPIPPAGPPPSSQVQLIMGSFLYSGGTTYHDNIALTLYSGGTASVEQPAASFDNGSASSGGATRPDKLAIAFYNGGAISVEQPAASFENGSAISPEQPPTICFLRLTKCPNPICPARLPRWFDRCRNCDATTRPTIYFLHERNKVATTTTTVRRQYGAALAPS